MWYPPCRTFDPFMWDLSFGTFHVGSFMWDLSSGTLHMGPFMCDLFIGALHVGPFMWDPPCVTFQAGPSLLDPRCETSQVGLSLLDPPCWTFPVGPLYVEQCIILNQIALNFAGLNLEIQILAKLIPRRIKKNISHYFHYLLFDE